MPAATPFTVPVNDPTVAIVVLLLLHVPPGVASLSVMLPPVPTVVVPVTGPGTGFTVTL